MSCPLSFPVHLLPDSHIFFLEAIYTPATCRPRGLTLRTQVGLRMLGRDQSDVVANVRHDQHF